MFYTYIFICIHTYFENQKVIDKQNADDKSFTKHVKDGDDFSADDDFDNAIVNYNKALKLKLVFL